MLRVLKNFWYAVADVFAEAWDKPPRQSRLTHGLGIISLGFVMDAIAEQYEGIEPTTADFAAHLRLIAPHLRLDWREWQLGPYTRKWNDFQNTPRDVQVIADHLLSSLPARAQARRESRAASVLAPDQLSPQGRGEIRLRRRSDRCPIAHRTLGPRGPPSDGRRTEVTGRTEMAKKAVVLLSGGLDSTTVTGGRKDAMAIVPYALSFRYGQRHEIELAGGSTRRRSGGCRSST